MAKKRHALSVLQLSGRDSTGCTISLFFLVAPEVEQIPLVPLHHNFINYWTNSPRWLLCSILGLGYPRLRKRTSLRFISISNQKWWRENDFTSIATDLHVRSAAQASPLPAQPFFQFLSLRRLSSCPTAPFSGAAAICRRAAAAAATQRLATPAGCAAF